MIQYDQWKMLKNTVFRSDRIPDEWPFVVGIQSKKYCAEIVFKS
jgi:hypothetical protein